MIDAAIQTILTNAGYDSYNFVSIDPDKDLPMPARPFLVHKEQLDDTVRTKDGIEGYKYQVSIVVVHDKAIDLHTLCATIATLMEGQTGLIEGTNFEFVEYLGNDGIYQDQPRSPYYDNLIFAVETTNK